MSERGLQAKSTPMSLFDLRRSAWLKLSPEERAALSARPFTRAEGTAFEGEKRAAMLVRAARLAAPCETVRARACERLASAWRTYRASRWPNVDRWTTPPEHVERLDQALHHLSTWWPAGALASDTIARLIKDRF